jgi:hypothetical protein
MPGHTPWLLLCCLDQRQGRQCWCCTGNLKDMTQQQQHIKIQYRMHTMRYMLAMHSTRVLTQQQQGNSRNRRLDAQKKLLGLGCEAAK